MSRTRATLFIAIITALFVGVAVLTPRMTIAQEGASQSIEADLGSAFTYQGHLDDNGSPANGSYNFRFYLWDDENKTTLLGTYPSGGTLPVDVSDGKFAVALDFGAEVFNGQALWLEIEVGGSLLSPLQQLTAAPYAQSLRPGAVISGTVSSPGATLNLNNPAGAGLRVDHAGSDGILVCSTGFDTSCNTSGRNNGVEIGSTQGHGIYVDSAGDAGMYIADAGEDGVVVYDAVDDGLRVSSAGDDGVQVSSAGDSGMYIAHADGDGIFICATGDQTTCTPSSSNDGIEIGSTENYGIRIDDAGYTGVYVVNANGGGVAAWADADGDGFGDGVYAEKNGTDAEWGIYTSDKLFAGGGVSTNRLTLVARVGGDQALSAGDVVSALGAADPLPENSMPLPLVGLASEDISTGLIGVVEARLQRLAVPQHPEEEQAGREPIFTLRSVEGPARPGDYVAITVVGVAYVKVAPGADIQPGQRLTASQVAGAARPLQTRTLEGMLVSEGAPVIGVALAAPEAGSDTIPVFVSLR